MNRKFALLLSLCLLGQAHAAEGSPVMRLATLEWLPYTGAALAHEGWSSYVVESAAKRFGYRAEVEYFPWTRAMQLGMKDAQYAGYFPAYYTTERAQKCYFSSSIGSSTIGFAYLKSAPLQWQSLQDLTTRTIAVVAGFSNGPSFDEWVRQHKLTVDASPSDTLNLRKLLAHRVDTVVIDKLVLRYLLATEPTLAKQRDRIVFHERPLAELSLHVCFQKTAEGRAMQQAFDTALHSLPLHKMENDYFQRIDSSALP